MPDYSASDMNRRQDLAPVALEALAADDELSQGIVGLKMAPIRPVPAATGAQYVIDFTDFDLKNVNDLRALGGRPAQVRYNENSVDYATFARACESFLDLDVLEMDFVDRTKKETGAIRRAIHDWKMLHELRVLTMLDANLGFTTPPVKWDAGANTIIREEILTEIRTIVDNCRGMVFPNVFACSYEVAQVLELAPELTALLGGIIDLSQLTTGQITGWLREQGFEYVLIGRSPNWVGRDSVYILRVDTQVDAGLDEVLECASSPCIRNFETWTYMEYGKRINYAVQAHVGQQTFYATMGRRLNAVLT